MTPMSNPLLTCALSPNSSPDNSPNNSPDNSLYKRPDDNPDNNPDKNPHNNPHNKPENISTFQSSSKSDNSDLISISQLCGMVGWIKLFFDDQFILF